MPSTIHISESSRCLCAKRTSHTLQTPTNWIGGTLGVKSKHYLQRLRAVLLAEDRMASGLDQGHHHNHGRTAIEDLEDLKIEGHRGLIDIEAGMTDVSLTMNTGLLRRHHRANDDLTGAMAPMRDMAICQHHLPMADTHYHLFLATGLTVIAAEEVHQQATRTFPATAMTVQDAHASPTAPGGHVNPTTGPDVAQGTLETREMDIRMTAQIAEGRTEIGIGKDLATRGILPETGGTVERDRGARRGGIGTATGMETFTGGDDVSDIKWMVEARILANWRTMVRQGLYSVPTALSMKTDTGYFRCGVLGHCSISLASYGGDYCCHSH